MDDFSTIFSNARSSLEAATLGAPLVINFRHENATWILPTAEAS